MSPPNPSPSLRPPPMLNVGPLSGRVYIVTKYRVLDAEKGQYEAQEKFDVTAQFEVIAAERARNAA